MAKEITGEDLRKWRIKLNYDIETILENLNWDRLKLAELYGMYVQQKVYTLARIGQLINARKGSEECAEEMLKWMKEQLEKQTTKKRIGHVGKA